MHVLLFLLHLAALAALLGISMVIMGRWLRINSGLKLLEIEGGQRLNERIAQRISLLRREAAEYFGLPPEAPVQDLKITLAMLDEMQRQAVLDLTAAVTRDWAYSADLSLRLVMIATATMLSALYLGGKEAIHSAVGIGGVVILVSLIYGVLLAGTEEKIKAIEKKMLDGRETGAAARSTAVIVRGQI